MGPRIGSSLKVRIAAVAGLLFLAGIALITLFVTRILHDDMQEMASKQQLTAASYIARDIDAKLALRLDSLQRVALNIPSGLFRQPEILQAWLDDRKAIHTLFPTGLMIIPPDGGPALAETPRLATRPKSFADRDWFIEAKATGQAVISKPLIARATKEPALVMAVPLFDPQGKLLGVLAGVTPLATPGFLDLIIGARPGMQGSYQLISPQHRIFVLASNIHLAVTPLPADAEDPIIHAALTGSKGVKIMRNPNQEEEFAAIVDVPKTGWLLLARQPSRDAFAAVSNTVRNALLITTLLALPIIILLLAALSRLLHPLARLAGELHAMADGIRPLQPLQTNSTDEVADVAKSFNRLQSKLQEQEQQLAAMAHHDTLTGLPNRLLINDRLNKELMRISRSGHGLALLFLDLDGFKPVNDRHGHQVGDLVLIEIASRLQNCVRDADSLARLGGDEFLILLAGTEAPLVAAERVARDCILALAEPIRIGDQQMTVGISIGIAICEGSQADSLRAEQLVSQADVAMYRAKAGGRNRYIIHDPAFFPTTLQ